MRRQDRACIGIPLHWGFIGDTRRLGPNSLTPFVGDANTETPDSRPFLSISDPSRARVMSRPPIRTPTARARRSRTADPADAGQSGARRRHPRLSHAGPAAADARIDAGGEADRCQQMHRLQGVPVGLRQMERHHAEIGYATGSLPASGGSLVQMFTLMRAEYENPDGRNFRMADPQGWLHALHRSGLS